MEWTGEALLIGVRRHGETSLVIEAMVAGRGRWLGLVRGGRSAKHAATLQPGNTVRLTWRARLEEHLGVFTAELIEARAARLIADRTRLYLSSILCEHLRLLPERDANDRLLGLALDLLDSAPDGVALARFELALLDELGFGLDLSACAATGVSEGLTFVSPKSGRAVSAAAGEPYRDRLLALPRCLLAGGNGGPGDAVAALRLTGHFLDVHVWGARGGAPPPMRGALVDALAG